MAKRCSIKCAYFPLHSYEKTNKIFTVDKFGVKHGQNKILCDFDDHLITKWEQCPNYKDKSKSKPIATKKDKTIILLGKSASGKDYILNYLIQKYGFNAIVSHTTRPIRTNEVNGKDYYFIRKSEFALMDKNKQFIETRKYTTCLNNQPDVWHYGIAKQEFDTKARKICVVDTIGQKEIIKYCGKENVISIYIDSKDSVRETRAKLRGSFSQSEWDRRLKDDNTKFKKIKYDYMVKNNANLRQFEHNIENILRKEDLIG